MDLVKLIRETRASGGQGSTEGRNKMKSSGDKAHSSSKKARAHIYKSIMDALKKGFIGQIFSTKGSDRLYVITKQKWGKSDAQSVGGRTAKGFSSGSIPSDFNDVKKYSVRTMVRHGKNKSKRFSSDKYWQKGKKE